MKTEMLMLLGAALAVVFFVVAMGPREVLAKAMWPVHCYVQNNLVMSMKTRDLHNSIKTQRVIAPLAIGANATKTGKIVDRKGYSGVEFIASYGAVTTTGTIVTLVVVEGDVTGTMTSVADADLIGTELLASLPIQATSRTSEVGKNVSKRVGYKGNKRYVGVNAVQTGTTSVGCVSVEALLFSPETAPTVNP